MNIWSLCDGPSQIKPLDGLLERMVESQEEIATRSYVDTLEEQALLEDLLDATKPPYPPEAQSYHYLLKTPFRYPPLKWGSRFGGVHEPSIFYGALNTHTALAETAYYRFVFWFSIQASAPKPSINTQHTLFSVGFSTQRALTLEQPPFQQYRPQLAHPKTYSDSQQLGSAMRSAGVEAFSYISARDPAQGLCLGLFTPNAFASQAPTLATPWVCELSAFEVVFKQAGAKSLTRYSLENFLYEGEFPLPA